MSPVMIITGGSRGIGAAAARRAAASGYAVCINYRGNSERANALVAAIEATGGRALAVQADVANERETMRLFETVDRKLGRVTALISSAGLPGGTSRVENLGAEHLDDMLAVNVDGLIYCAREAVRRMSTERGGSGGSIVNLSSVSSRLGSPHYGVHYAASKGAVDSFTIGLAKEVAGEGIRVNAVRPGLIDTEIHAAAGQPDRVQQVGKNLPMKRAGTADEVAAAILWLLSDEASYVSGAILDVAGAL